MVDAAASREAMQAAARERLHPLSWLFLLLQQLKSFALPLIVLLFSGRGEQSSWDLFGVAAAGVMAVVSVWHYFTYRYGLLDHAVVIRSGLLQRNLRLIPFDRVQNVVLHQTLLHRVAGVAAVKLESAGGMGHEARMDVLRLAQAEALAGLIRQQQRQTATAAAAGDDSTVWLALPTRELVRLGLISNRGMLVVAALFAYLSQGGGDLIGSVSRYVANQVEAGMAWAQDLHLGPLAYVLGSLALLVAMLAAVRLLSIALAIVHFHGFTLTAGVRELHVVRGLLNRVQGHLPMRRIQGYSLRESLLHRWFDRQSLRVDRASVEAVNDAQSLQDLVPIAPPHTMDAILSRLLPEGAWPLGQWQALHPRAWWRQFALPALLALVATAVLTAWHGPSGLWALLLLPLLFWRARVWARYAGWTLHGGVIAFRQGWLDRRWRFAEVRKLQAIRIAQSPFDRRHGMATLQLDLAGASPMEPALAIPYLPADTAATLAEALRAGMPRDGAPAAVSRARTAASAAPAG